jgi:salicylate hydroxylase
VSSIRRIAIVGAGLGGLSAAIALRQQGFEVDVFEQAPELGEFGAGINISPNAVRVFDALGLTERLRSASFLPTGIAWRDWTEGRLQKVMPLNSAQSDARYYVVHRVDLHRILVEAAGNSGLHLNKRCTNVELRDRSVGLSFADGTSHEAELVIGCDGIRSTIRKYVFGGEGPTYAGTMCWRSLIPADTLPPDLQDGNVTQWGGPGGFVISYYVRQGQFVNIVAVRRHADWAEESWSVPSTNEELVRAFPEVGPQVGELLRQAKRCTKWGQFTGEHAAQWTKGRVTLLGDSAHAMLATFGQGACMGFEDSYVLAKWLSTHRDDPERALAGYEAVRKPRASKVQALSRTEVAFKNIKSPVQRLKRQWTYLTRHGITQAQAYRWIFEYDPVTQWH